MCEIAHGSSLMRTLFAALLVVTLSALTIATAEDRPEASGEKQTAGSLKSPATQPSADEFPTPAELARRMKKLEQEKAALAKVAYINLSSPVEEKPADFT